MRDSTDELAQNTTQFGSSTIVLCLVSLLCPAIAARPLHEAQVSKQIADKQLDLSTLIGEQLAADIRKRWRLRVGAKTFHKLSKNFSHRLLGPSLFRFIRARTLAPELYYRPQPNFSLAGVRFPLTDQGLSQDILFKGQGRNNE